MKYPTTTSSSFHFSFNNKCKHFTCTYWKMQTIKDTRILVNDPGKTQDGKTCERERAFINFSGHFQNLQSTQDNLSLHFQLGNMCHLLGCTAATENTRGETLPHVPQKSEMICLHTCQTGLINAVRILENVPQRNCFNPAVRYGQKSYGLQLLLSAVRFLGNRANNLSLLFCTAAILMAVICLGKRVTPILSLCCTASFLLACN